MSEKNDKIEFKMLDYKRLENDFVSFELEDGSIVKVKIDLDRVGKAVNFKNRDGTPRYTINTSVKVSIIPSDRKFSVEKSSVKSKNSSPRRKTAGIVRRWRRPVPYCRRRWRRLGREQCWGARCPAASTPRRWRGSSTP